MSLPRFSRKRKAEIADGKRYANGNLKMTAAEFVEAVKKRKGKSAMTERQSAMKAADKWFSEWIRLRDSDENGMAFCVTSRKRIRKHWRDLDCGHYISRAKMATRYNERNAHAQSGSANRFQGGHFIEHGIAIERLHGAGTRAELERLAMMECKRSAQDFQHIADHYHGLVLVIRETEPSKYYRQPAL